MELDTGRSLLEECALTYYLDAGSAYDPFLTRANKELWRRNILLVIISPGGRCPFKDDVKKTGDQILFFYYYLSNSSLVHGGVGVQRDFALVVVWRHKRSKQW